MSDPNSALASKFSEKFPYIEILLWGSLILLIVGVFSPIMTTTQWWIIKKSFSIYTGLIDLYSRNEFFLFFIIIIHKKANLFTLFRIISINNSKKVIII